MVKKTKGLYLGLLVSLLGVGNVMQAYRLIIKNKTPYKVRFEVIYHGESAAFSSCMPDVGELNPNGRARLRSGACTVTKVKADVYEPGSEVTKGAPRVIKAEKYYAPAGRAGNSTWVIRGPFYVRGVVRYTITRE